MPKCFCALCRGATRDKRTIRRHLNSPYYKQNAENEAGVASVSDQAESGHRPLNEPVTRARALRVPADYEKRPCFCPRCNGKIRNHRTVEVHTGAHTLRTDFSSPSTVDCCQFTISDVIEVPCSTDDHTSNFVGNADNFENEFFKWN